MTNYVSGELARSTLTIDNAEAKHQGTYVCISGKNVLVSRGRSVAEKLGSRPKNPIRFKS